MIAIIDYDAGNLTSVARAVTHIGFENIITRDKETILQAERIIFPGVGAAGSAMESLQQMGLDKVIRDLFHQGRPILGICLGTQIIMAYSNENDTKCIGLVEGEVESFPPNLVDQENNALKIPHMGWNSIHLCNARHPVLADVRPDDEFYFVHSYYPQPEHQEQILAITDYGVSFPSVIGLKNLVATQFHPEKSGEAGLNLLRNFCKWSFR
jgi:glutamine amidotransferase